MIGLVRQGADVDVSQHMCSHCYLPVTPHSLRRKLNGREQAFCCYGCCLAFQVSAGNTVENSAAWLLIRLGVGAFLAMNIMLFSLLLYSGSISEQDQALLQIVNYLLWALATPVLIILGGPFLKDAWRGIQNGRLSTDSLISIAVLAAYGYSVIVIIQGGTGVYFDTATMLLVLFTLGRYLEATGRAQAVRSVEPFFAAEDGWVTVVEANQDKSSRVRDLKSGMKVRVLPGDWIYVDGFVLEGGSKVDESIISGESRWLDKRPGSTVRSGSINQSGHLLIECSSTASESNWATICRAVRNSLNTKTRMQQLADKVAAIFVPAVILLAGATVLYWSGKTDFNSSLLAGLSVLVVACPCALGLATPLATTMGIGLFSRRGILIRGGEIFETLARIKGVAFDKTGTVTGEKMRLIRIESGIIAESEILINTAAIEKGANHPIARAILAATEERQLTLPTATKMRTLRTGGITGRILNQEIAAGTQELMNDFGWVTSTNLKSLAAKEAAAGYLVIWIGWSGFVRGFLVLEDDLDDLAQFTIQSLRQRGLYTSLITGDKTAIAQRIAESAEFEGMDAELTPDNKVKALSRLTQTYGSIAMVGDGINDAPALASSAVGIAVGGATDLARETADVVLPENGLYHLPWMFEVAVRVRRSIQVNLLCAFGYNIVALTLAAMGHIQPIFAALLMVGSSVLVIFNSLRLGSLTGDQDSGHKPSMK